jgi:hypothetical protein
LLVRERLARIRQDPVVRSVRLTTSQHTFRFYAREGFVLKEIIPDGYAPGLDQYRMLLTMGLE